MKKIWTVASSALVLCAAPRAAQAQLLPDIPLSVEVRGGVGVPVGDFAGEEGIEAGTGFGFGVGAMVGVTPMFSAYGAYQWTRFGCGECEGIENLDDEVTDSGFELGGQADLPFRPAGLAPWVRAGVLLHELEFSGDEGDVSSDRSLGFALGGGITYPLGPTLSVTPGIHYRNYSAEFDLGNLDLNGETDVSHLTLDVGLVYRF